MYLRHFALTRMPFETPAHTDELFESNSRREAEMRLRYPRARASRILASIGDLGDERPRVTIRPQLRSAPWGGPPMALIDDLHSYYERKGILATRFTCRHKADCKGGSPSFTGPNSAYVGERYEDAHRFGLPRLLFVSLDSGSGVSDPEKRLPHAVRSWTTEHCLGPKNRHWSRTHEHAACILGRIRGTSMTPREAQLYFAHTNSAKCCQNKERRRQADRRLFDNCRPYLSGELAVLCPDVIVTQGGWARVAVSAVVGDWIAKDSVTNRVQLHGREVFWLNTHHPARFGAFNGQRRQWGDFAGKIRVFVNELVLRGGKGGGTRTADHG